MHCNSLQYTYLIIAVVMVLTDDTTPHVYLIGGTTMRINTAKRVQRILSTRIAVTRLVDVIVAAEAPAPAADSSHTSLIAVLSYQRQMTLCRRRSVIYPNILNTFLLLKLSVTAVNDLKHLRM